MENSGIPIPSNLLTFYAKNNRPTEFSKTPIKVTQKTLTGYYFISIHGINCPVWVFDMTTNCIVDANTKALHFSGYSQEELIGLHIGRLWNDEELENILHELKYFAYSHTYFTNIKHLKKNNETINMRAQFSQLLINQSFWEVILIP